MTRPTPLLPCKKGASAVEFALVAPVFLMLIIGIMEYCRYAWTVQTLNSVAYSAARCATFNPSCSTASTATSFAVTQAADHGIAITSSNVTFASNTSCNSNSAQNKVQISYAFPSAFSGFVKFIPSSAIGTGCFTYNATSA